MNLIPEDKLKAMLAADERVLTAQKKDGWTYIQDDTQAGPYLRFYILLTEAPELFANEGFSAEQVFYSRYYWYCRYSKVRQAISGFDAGLEQKEFKILEHPYPVCTPDWSVVERIQALALHDASAEL